MPEPADAPAGLLCISVSGGTRRADLAVPSGVSVAQLLPELADLLDLHPARGAPPAELCLSRITGGALAPDLGLASQGVGDGDVLTLAATPETHPPCVYDDHAEAVADAVTSRLASRSPGLGAAGWLAGVVVTVLVLFLVLLTLPVRPAVGGAMAGLLTLSLLGTAAAASSSGQDLAAHLVCWLASAGAAASVAAVLSQGSVSTDPGRLVAAGGAALMATGAAAVGVLGRARLLLLAPVLVGLGLAVGGGTALLADVPLDRALTACLTLAVVAGGVVPEVAVALATRPGAGGRAPPTDRESPLDGATVATQVTQAHELVLASSVAVGLLLTGLAPVAVGLGPFGVLLAVTCAVVVLLRARQHHAAAQALAGTAGGIAALATAAVSVVVLHPAWRVAAAGVAGAAALLALWGSLTPARSSPHRGRLGDLVEATALVALLPLLVATLGMLDLVA